MSRRTPVLALAMLALSPSAKALDAITFGTNWVAEAEHGGYYQAEATGIYERYGLDVDIRPGGPQVNHSALLAAGKLDFAMGVNCFTALNYVQAGAPMATVAAHFQKDPQVLIAHPDSDIESLEDMRGRAIMISTDAQWTYWKFLEARYGFEESQIRRYTFNLAPFLADPDAIQEGYVTAEPFAIEQELGEAPKVFLLADYGYDTYATTIDTSWALIEEDPDLVQRFLDASAEGWREFLEGDPTPAYELIQSHNPEMSLEQMEFTRAEMIERGVVISGEAVEGGVGAMSHERWRAFFDFAVEAGIYPADLPLERAYTLRFVGGED